MKKNYLFLAATAVVMASCANEDFIGDTPTNLSESQAIGFNMSTPNATRAGNSTDAGKLGNMFIVWGEKNEKGTGAAAADSNIVFQNYVVEYADNTGNTANTTVSNTTGWEYVGIAPFTANVTPTVTKQTIKYWDDSASSYTFTAVSAKKDDISGGNIVIAKTTSDPAYNASTNGSDSNKGYTIQVKSGAKVGNIYYADREVFTKSAGYNHNTVKFTFRNFQSKIRFGIYETVPGYKVVITGIKYPDATNANTTIEHPTNPTSGEPDKTFGIGGDFVVAGDNTKYTVTYESTGTNVNRAKVAVDTNSSKEKSINTTGTSWLSTSWTSTTTNSCIGDASTSATYDKTDGAYTAILPNTDNETNMKLQVKYDLYSEDTGERIAVDYKTVEVPAAYCQWKSNYAYTYLFKISDKSADLNPITFDACVVEEQTGNQETITEVSEPSITTFGVKDNKVVTGKDEYEAGSDIYASVVEYNSTNSKYEEVTLSSSNTKLYTVTSTSSTTGGAVQEITEASVANCITNGGTNDTKTVTDLNGCVMTATPVTINTTGNTAPVFVSAVPTEEGTTATRELSALKWNGSASTVYAVQYTNTATNKVYYKIVKVAAQ